MSKRLFTPWFGPMLFVRVIEIGSPILITVALISNTPDPAARCAFVLLGLMLLVFIVQLYSFWHRDDRRILRAHGWFVAAGWWFTTLISAPLAWFGAQKIYEAIEGIANDDWGYL